MHGNVGEWCIDSYDSKYYAKWPRFDAQGKPVILRDPKGGVTASGYHVFRGGTWNWTRLNCTSSYRATNDGWNYGIGFRIVGVIPDDKLLKQLKAVAE